MAEHYNPKESLRAMLDELVTSVEGLVDVLRSLPADGWKRESRHATQGVGLTLQRWVERDLEHIDEHLTTVKLAN
ncbi:MAG: hypothetical protein ACXWNC_09820 [Anaerolineales bacterium]